MFVKERNLTAPKSCLDDVRKYSKSIEISVRNDNSMVIKLVLLNFKIFLKLFLTTSIECRRKLTNTLWSIPNNSKGRIRRQASASFIGKAMILISVN